MTWDWRGQENHYQPCRVKVVEREHYTHDWNVSAWGYSVAIFNEATHAIQYLTKSGDFGDGDTRIVNRKEDAVAIAKQVAVDHDLPYIVSKDYGTYAELHHGPVLHCLICDNRWRIRGEWARGWERDVCPDCRQAASAYKEQHAEIDEVTIAQDVVARPGHWHPYQGAHRALIRYLVRIAVPNDAIETRKARGQCDIGKADSVYGAEAVVAPMKSWQLEALRRAIETINTIIKVAAQEGRRQGSSLLEQLAAGTVHPNDFSDLRGSGE
jgi:hypothetical protein